MKQILIVLICTVHVSLLFSQEKELTIKHFKEDALDISAREHEILDINDEACALLKIRTGVKNLNIDGNRGVEKKTEYEGETWVWVPAGTRILKFTKSGFPLQEYTIPMALKKSSVYTLRLSATGDNMTNDIDTEVFSLLFRFNIDNVFISKGNSAAMQSTGNVALFELPKDKYSFTITKDGYEDQLITVPLTKDTTIAIELSEGKNIKKLKLPGIVIVNSVPEGAIVYLNDVKVGITPYTGKIISGSYSLRISKKMFYEYNGNFVLEEASTKELPVVDLKTKSGLLSIKTHPENANVFIDSVLLGKSPVENLEVERGRHILTTDLDKYHPVEKEIDVTIGQHTSLDLNLQETLGTKKSTDKSSGFIEIDSEPQGAILRLNGKEVGSTPWKSSSIKAGKYTVEIQQKLWNNEEFVLNLEDKQHLKKFVVLTKNYGTVHINADSSKIFIDDEFKSDNEYIAKLEPGEYIVRAKGTNHDDDVRKILVTNNSTDTVVLKPEPRMGSLSIITNPVETRGATLLIDGEQYRKKTPVVVPLFTGDYEISLKKQGYIDIQRKVTITRNETSTLDIEMERYKGSAYHKLKKNKIWRAGWIATGALLTGTGMFLNSQAEKAYSDYGTATTEAKDLRSKTISYHSVAPLCIGLGLLCTAPVLLHQLKIKKLKNEIQIKAQSQQGMTSLGIKMAF